MEGRGRGVKCGNIAERVAVNGVSGGQKEGGVKFVNKVSGNTFAETNSQDSLY